MKFHSLFMGMFVAGALSMAGPAFAHSGMMHHDHDKMGEGCCDQNLPPEKAKMAEGAMHQVMEKNKPLFERMRKLHEQMRAVATADKFDRKAFMAKADEMASLHMTMEKNRANMMASVAEKLTASERRAMASCMERNFHRGEFGHGEWGHHDGGMGNSHNDAHTYNQ